MMEYIEPLAIQLVLRQSKDGGSWMRTAGREDNNTLSLIEIRLRPFFRAFGFPDTWVMNMSGTPQKMPF
jgi:hypothetical protein